MITSIQKLYLTSRAHALRHRDIQRTGPGGTLLHGDAVLVQQRQRVARHGVLVGVVVIKRLGGEHHPSFAPHGGGFEASFGQPAGLQHGAGCGA